MEYIGYVDANAFVKISGISKDDLEKKVYSNKEFQKECMYRFGRGQKCYIKIDKAIQFIGTNLMINEYEL
ncbi:hypothetical protein NPE45_001922 [Staphylococcus aureus]|nr:hypothetical protein [Staphylococcus aureus]